MNFSEIKRQVLAVAHYGAVDDRGLERNRLACMNIHYAGLALIDFGRATDSLAFYAKNFTGVLDGVEMDHEVNAELIRKRQENVERKTRHVSSNYLFRLAEPDTAYALSIITVYLEDESRQVGVTPLTVADCGEKYVRNVEGVWQLQYRYVCPVAGAPR